MTLDKLAHYQRLARKRTACGALFVEDGKVLLVKPSYKPTWEIPGGIGEVLESPRETCLRECGEELGIEVALSHLAVLDWMPEPMEGAHDSLQMVFMGVPLTEAQKAAIVLPADELVAWEYVPFEEAYARLSQHVGNRVRLALAGMGERRLVYCEDGVVV